MLETARLRLRPAAETDIERLLVGMNDYAVARWLARPPFPYFVQDAHDFIAWTHDGFPVGHGGKYVIADRLSDRLLGVVSLEPADGRAELGYWIMPAEQRMGYVAEAIGSLLTDGAAELPANTTLYATVDPANAPSQAVLRKFGLCVVGEKPRTVIKTGQSATLLLCEAPLRR